MHVLLGVVATCYTVVTRYMACWSPLQALASRRQVCSLDELALLADALAAHKSITHIDMFYVPDQQGYEGIESSCFAALLPALERNPLTHLILRPFSSRPRAARPLPKSSPATPFSSSI